MGQIGVTRQVIISSGPKDLTSTDATKRIVCTWGIADALDNGAPHSQYADPSTQWIAKVTSMVDVTGDGIIPNGGSVGTFPDGYHWLDYDDVSISNTLFANSTGSFPSCATRTIRISWDSNDTKDFKVVIPNVINSWNPAHYQGGVSGSTNPLIGYTLNNAEYATTESTRDVTQHDCDGFPGGVNAFKFENIVEMDSGAYTGVPNYTNNAAVQKNIVTRSNNIDLLPSFDQVPILGDVTRAWGSVAPGVDNEEFASNFLQSMEGSVGVLNDLVWYRGATGSFNADLPYWDGSNLKISVAAGEKAVIACKLSGLNQFYVPLNDGRQKLFPKLTINASSSTAAGGAFYAGTFEHLSATIAGNFSNDEIKPFNNTSGSTEAAHLTPGSINWTPPQSMSRTATYYIVFDCSACTTSSVIVINDKTPSEVEGLYGSGTAFFTGTALNTERLSSSSTGNNIGNFGSGAINHLNSLYENYSFSLSDLSDIKSILQGQAVDASFKGGGEGEKHVEAITSWWPVYSPNVLGQPITSTAGNYLGDNGSKFNTLMQKIETQYASSAWDMSNYVNTASVPINAVHHHVYIVHPHSCPTPESLCITQSCDNYGITQTDCSGNVSTPLGFALMEDSIGNPVENVDINTVVMNYCDGVWNQAPHNMTCNCNNATCAECGADTIHNNTTYTVTQHDCTTPIANGTWGDIQVDIGALAQADGPIRAFIVPISVGLTGTPIHGGVTHTSPIGNEEVCFYEIPNNTAAAVFDEHTLYTAHTLTTCELYLLSTLYGQYNTLLDPANITNNIITQAGPVLVPPDEGTYAILLIDANGCFTSSPLKSNTIEFDGPPGMRVYAAVGYGCSPTNSVSLTIHGAPYVTSVATFMWGGPGGFTATSQNLSGLTLAGNYTVGIFDNMDNSNPDCYTELVLSVPAPIPPPTVTLNCPGTFCIGGTFGNVIASAVAGGGATITDYHWYEGTTLIGATDLGSTGTNSTYNPFSVSWGTTTIHVVVTDSIGCQSNTSCTITPCYTVDQNTSTAVLYMDHWWACYGEDLFFTGDLQSNSCPVGQVVWEYSSDGGSTYTVFETLGNLSADITSQLPYTTTTPPTWGTNITLGLSPLQVRVTYFTLPNPGGSCSPVDHIFYIDGIQPVLSCPPSLNETCWNGTPTPLTVSEVNNFIGTFVWMDLSGTVLQTDVNTNISTYQPLANNTQQDFTVAFSVQAAGGAFTCTAECLGIRTVFSANVVPGLSISSLTPCIGDSVAMTAIAPTADYDFTFETSTDNVNWTLLGLANQGAGNTAWQYQPGFNPWAGGDVYLRVTINDFTGLGCGPFTSSTIYVQTLPGGCTDPLACNYDPLATCDDGSCLLPGCMDPCALDYDPTATCDTGITCTFPAPQLFYNYFPSGCAIQHMFTVADATTSTFGGMWGFSSVTYELFFDPLGANTSVNGPITTSVGLNYWLTIYQEDCTGNVIDTYGAGDYKYIITLHYPSGSPACDITLERTETLTPEVLCGCTDPTSCNYDPLATCDDGSCIMPDGCTDASACNFDPLALCDDGSCILPDGCTDPLAVNYCPLCVCDDGSCYYCGTILMATAADVRCHGQNNGTITIDSVTGGSPPYSYLWSTGSTSSIGIIGLAAGTYTLDILDNNGCLLTTSWTITEPSLVTMIPTWVVDNTDCLVANGSITPTPAGGVAPYTFSWSASSGGVVPAGQSTNQNLTGLIAGTYSLIITDVNGCVNSPIPAIVSDGFVNGCMDPLACNYDALATCDDGSCTYVTQPDPTLTFVDTTCEVSLVANWGAGIPCAQVDRVEIWLDIDNTPGGDTLIMTIFQAQLGNSFVQDLGTDDCSGQGFTAAITPFLPTTPVLYMQIHYINTATVTTTGPFGHNAGAPALISSTNNAPVACGCTDPIATNYNAAATCDCCCVYGNAGCTDDGTFANQGQTWWTDPASNITGIAYDVITGIANYPGAQPANYCPTCTTDDGSCLYPPGPSCCTSPSAHFTWNSLATPCLIYYGSYLSCGWSPTVTLIAQVHHVQWWDPINLIWVTTNSVVVASPSINSYIHWQYSCQLGVDDFQNGGLDGTYRVVIVTTDSNGLICTAEGDGIYIDFPECGCTDPLATNYCPTCTCGTNTCIYPDPCTWTATLTPEVCNASGATVTVAGGTPPFTFVWEDLTNPGITIPFPSVITYPGFIQSDLNWWVGNTPFDYNSTNQFVCHITDSFGCTETVGIYQPVYSPQIGSILVHVVTGDIMYCPPASPPPTGGSYALYPGTTVPPLTILSATVTGPGGYSSTLLADTNLAAGNYTAICVMSNGCTFAKNFTIYNDPQLSGCTDPTACNFTPMAACDDGTCFSIDIVTTDIDCTGVGSVTVDLITPGFVSGPNYTFYLTAPNGGQFGHILGAPITWPHTYSTLTQVGTYTVGVYGDGLSGSCTVPFTIADNNVHGCMDVTASNTNEDCLGNTVVPTCDDCCDYCFTTVNDVITCIDTSIGQIGSIILTVAGGTAPYGFLWSTGATTQNLSGITTPGTYTCTITDQTLCVTTYTGIIIDCTPYVSPGISATILTDTPCAVDMQITVAPGGSIGPATIWFTSDAAGLIDVPGSSSTGFSATMPNPLNYTYDINCNSSSPYFTNEITGWTQWNLVPGTTYYPNLTYQFPNGIVNTVIGLPITIPMNAAMVCGCMDALADNTNEDCDGTTVIPTCDICCEYCNATLTVAAIASACNLGTILWATILNCGACTGTYVWTGNLAGAVSTNNGSITIPTGTGPVTCTWTDAATGCVYTDTITFPAPPTSVALGQNNTCANNVTIDNGTITQTVAPGTPPYTYAWTATNGGVVPGGQTTNQNLTGLVPGDYTCVVTDATGCTDTATTTITDCCIIGCTDVLSCFSYDPLAICTCNSGAPNDCCVYSAAVATLTQVVTACNNTITLSVTDTNVAVVADTASATFQVIQDPAGLATYLLLPLPLPPTGVDTYGLVYIEDCSNWWQSIDDDYAIEYVITYQNGCTETIQSPTVTYARRICGCTDPTATNYDPTATCDDGSCLYPASLTCALTSTIAVVGCQEILTVTASDTSANTVQSWQFDYIDTSGPTTVYTNTDSSTSLSFAALVDDACTGAAGFNLVPNDTYEVLVTVTFTNGTTGTCTTNTITTQNFICGCTDSLASIYDATATCDDGSCITPCCDTPILQATGNDVGICDREWEATLNCNTVAGDNAETVVTTLQFWDTTLLIWQDADINTYNPTPGVNAITTVAITYNYDCTTTTFGTYGTGDYRAVFDITYVGGNTCQLISAQDTITFGTCGCTDVTVGDNPNINGDCNVGAPCVGLGCCGTGNGWLATNFDPVAQCDDGCLYAPVACCTPDSLGLDPMTDPCTPDLIFEATCNPITVSHVINWYMWDTSGGVWVLLSTATVVVASTSVIEILDNSFLHTGVGVSETYRAEIVITYASNTCTIFLDYIYTPIGPRGCMDNTSAPTIGYPDVNGHGDLAVYDCAISTTSPTLVDPCPFPCTNGYMADDYDPCAICPGPCNFPDVFHIWENCDTGVEYTFVDIAQTGAGSESHDYWVALDLAGLTLIPNAHFIKYNSECYEYIGISTTNTLGTIINVSIANYQLLDYSFYSCANCAVNYHEWQFCVCPSSWATNPLVWGDCAEDRVNIVGDPFSTYPMTNTAINNTIFFDYIEAQNGGPITIGDVFTIRHTGGGEEYCITYLGQHGDDAATHYGYTTMTGLFELTNDFYFFGPSDVYADCTLCAAAPDLFLEWTRCGTSDVYNIVDIGATVNAANTIAWVGINSNAAIIMPTATWGPTIGLTVIKLTNGDCYTFTGYNTAQAPFFANELIDSSPTVTIEVDCATCLLVPGCTDPSALNWNFNCAAAPVVATISDGCCIYPVSGCMDDGVQTQNYWDGIETWNGINSQPPNDYATVLSTVTYPTQQADNYNILATSDDGTCFYSGCIDPSANNYCSYCTVDDGSCNYCDYGCTDPLYVQYDPLATCDCNSSDPAQGYVGPLDPLLDNDCCIDICVNGCMDCGTIWENDTINNPTAITCLTQTGTASSGPGSVNFDPLATCPCCCTTPIDGCTDATALNYDPTANNDDGSCLYCSGFTTVMGPALSGTGQAFVLDAASAPTATNWFEASLVTTIEDPEGSFTGSAIVTMGPTAPHAQFGATVYITIFDSAGATVNSGSISSSPGTTFNTLGLGWGGYTMVLSHISAPVYGVSQTCDQTFTFDIQTPVCDDATAFNYNPTPVPAPYYIVDNTLCVPMGFCACSVTATSVISTVCGIPSEAKWSLYCDPGTTINGFLEQSFDLGATWTNIAPAITGFSAGFNTQIHVETTLVDCWYRLTYTETTNPSCATVVMAPVVITGMPICGCTDVTATNYDPAATVDCITGCVPDAAGVMQVGPNCCCIYCIWGCTDPLAANYNPLATCDDGSCLYPIEGCTDPTASNYSSGATIDDGSCIYCDSEYWDCIPTVAESNNSCTGNPAVTFLNSQGILLFTNTYDVTELAGINTFPNADMALTSLVLTHGINATFSNYYYQSSQPCGSYPADCCDNGFVKKKITSITHTGMPGLFFTTWQAYIDAAVLAGVPSGSLILAPASDGCEPISGYNVSIEGSTVSSTPSTATIISGALGSPTINSDTINIVTCCTGRCNCTQVAIEGPNTSQAACLSDPFCCIP